MRGLGAAVALLTRLPLSPRIWEEQDVHRSVQWLPLVGAVIGLAIAAVYAGLSLLVPSMVAAGLSVAFGVFATGALHEDGLADTIDGFGGGSDSEDVLRIMKDPAHGTYGVVALALSLLLRIIALAAVSPAAALGLLPLVHAMSRGGALGLMAVLPPATGDGLGAAHVGDGLRRQVMIGTATSVLIGLAVVGWWVGAFLLAAAGVTVYFSRLARRHIAGFTGDVLGATEQVCEITLLALGVALLELDLISVPVWR
ncbi:MAG: adenosylcobinamide-GDP ribazoletransferase [Acidimicrobiia bacterium]